VILIQKRKTTGLGAMKSRKNTVLAVFKVPRAAMKEFLVFFKMLYRRLNGDLKDDTLKKLTF
jgi:hypothetical protein